MTSILLLSAGGPDSARNYAESVEKSIDPALLDEWLPPSSAADIRATVSGRLAAWGLRDNTRGLAGAGVQPLIWDRIDIGTLALFSNATEYFASADVIGKGTSAEASLALWGSPEFRWLILLSNVSDVRIPLEVVRQAAGFAPSYNINRQTIVPRAWREGAIWSAIAEYLPHAAEGPASVREVAVESNLTDVFVTSPAVEPRAGRRREAALVARLKKWWVERDGVDAVCRLEIRPTPGAPPLYVDLYNRTTGELVEAKATATRADVRMAIGQLADYARFVEPDPRRVVLLPEEPSGDLLDLLAAEGISALVPGRDGFQSPHRG
jgi:hypothetical protein